MSGGELKKVSQVKIVNNVQSLNASESECFRATVEVERQKLQIREDEKEMKKVVERWNRLFTTSVNHKGIVRWTLYLIHGDSLHG